MYTDDDEGKINIYDEEEQADIENESYGRKLRKRKEMIDDTNNSNGLPLFSQSYIQEGGYKNESVDHL